jgi:hypothetical protein
MSANENPVDLAEARIACTLKSWNDLILTALRQHCGLRGIAKVSKLTESNYVKALKNHETQNGNSDRVKHPIKFKHLKVDAVRSQLREKQVDDEGAKAVLIQRLLKADASKSNSIPGWQAEPIKDTTAQSALIPKPPKAFSDYRSPCLRRLCKAHNIPTTDRDGETFLGDALVNSLDAY